MRQRAVELRQAVEVELVKCLVAAERRATQPASELLLLAACDLVFDEQREELGVGELGVDGLSVARLPPDAVPPDPDLDALPLKDRLRADLLTAYKELGATEFLKRNPELMERLLVKALSPEPPVTQNNTQVNVEWPPWVTSQRLAYRLEQRVADDILEASPSNAADLERIRMDKKGS